MATLPPIVQETWLVLELRVARLVRAFPGRGGEHHEPLGIGLLVLRNGLLKAGSPAPGDIHHRVDVSPIHDRKQLAGGSVIGHRLSHGDAIPIAGNSRNMRVKIDHGKTRPLNLRRVDVQHAAGLELIDLK